MTAAAFKCGCNILFYATNSKGKYMLVWQGSWGWRASKTVLTYQSLNLTSTGSSASFFVFSCTLFGNKQFRTHERGLIKVPPQIEWRREDKKSPATSLSRGVGYLAMPQPLAKAVPV